jgi:hypothetical protein
MESEVSFSLTLVCLTVPRQQLKVQCSSSGAANGKKEAVYVRCCVLTHGEGL